MILNNIGMLTMLVYERELIEITKMVGGFVTTMGKTYISKITL